MSLSNQEIQTQIDSILPLILRGAAAQTEAERDVVYGEMIAVAQSLVGNALQNLNDLAAVARAKLGQG